MWDYKCSDVTYMYVSKGWKEVPAKYSINKATVLIISL